MSLIMIHLLLILLLCPLSSLHAAEPVPLDGNLTFRNISNTIDYLEDPDHNLSFSDISGTGHPEWKKSEKNYINFGYTKSQYWFRFSFDNKTKKTFSWLLEVDFPPIDLIELYTPDETGDYRLRITGDTRPFSSRDIKYINYLFRMKQKPGTMTCYMKIDTVDSIYFNLNILSYSYMLDRLYREMPIFWIYFGLMLIIALYNLGAFIITREIGSLYLTCFITIEALFEFNIRGFASQYLWPNATWWASHANPFLVGFIVFWIALFLSNFVGFTMPWRSKIKKNERPFVYFTLVILVCAFFISIISLFVNIHLGLRLVNTLASINITGAFLIGIYMGFLRKPPSRAARIVTFAFAPYAMMSPVLGLTLHGILPSNFLTLWAQQIGTAIAVVFLSLGMSDKIKNMKNAIHVGERRYHHLVESTAEIIFTLDDKNRILSMNGAVKPHLGYRPEELTGTSFLDMIQDSWDEKTRIARQMVLEYISDLINKKKLNAKFRILFKNKYSHEPKELTVTLEYTGDKDTGYLILGKASPIIDDVLSAFLETEHYSYNLNNYLSNAEMMSQRLVRNLYKFTDPAVISSIRIALREAIINSIEHGNLNITFDEKTEATNAESYFNLIKERQMDPALTGKKVKIQYSLDSERVIYEITDEGSGFDYRSAFAGGPCEANELMLAHGRGLMIISDAFDRVDFNEKGNKIVLVKYFKKQ